MSEFAETRAMLLRRALGIAGFAGALEARLLREWLGDFVTCRYSQYAVAASYDRRPDGGALVTLPLRVRGAQEALLALHEMGHALLDLPPQASGRWEAWFPAGRFARHLERADERECEVFTDAFRLPRDLLRRSVERNEPDWDALVADSGCDGDTLRRRLEWMRTHPEPSLRRAPNWNTWGRYRIVERHTTLTRSLVVRPIRGGEELPVLEFPFRGEREYLALRRQLHGSLAALRPHEFVLKHRPEACAEREAGLLWEEWLASACETSAGGGE